MGIRTGWLVAGALFWHLVSYGQNEKGRLEELLSQYEKRLEALSADSGLTKLQEQYLGHLTALRNQVVEPEHRLLIEAELTFVRSGMPKREGTSSFPELKQLQDIFDSSRSAILESQAGELAKIEEVLRRELGRLAESGDEAANKEMNRRFGEADGSSVSPEPGVGSGTLLRFSVLQERLVLPQDSQDTESEGEVGMGLEEVGMRLSAEGGELASPGVSRTLLIYSGEGGSQEALGSLTIQGQSPVRVKEADDESEWDLKVGDEKRPLNLDGGEMFHLEKIPDSGRSLELRAGTSTISVRGTGVFLVPKSGELDHRRSKRSSNQGFRRDEEGIMLVRDGVVLVSGNGRSGGAENPIGHLDGGSLRSGALLRDAFAEDPYLSTYNDHLKYYPKASSWLLADFDSGFRGGLGPMVECPGWVEETQSEDGFTSSWGKDAGRAAPNEMLAGSQGALRLEFPPIEGGYYRYVSFDLGYIGAFGSRGRRAGQMWQHPLWLYLGEKNPEDATQSILMVESDSLPPLEGFWVEVVVDLQAIMSGKEESSANPIEVFHFDCRTAVHVDTIRFHRQLGPEELGNVIRPLVHRLPVPQLAQQEPGRIANSLNRGYTAAVELIEKAFVDGGFVEIVHMPQGSISRNKLGATLGAIPRSSPEIRRSGADSVDHPMGRTHEAARFTVEGSVLFVQRCRQLVEGGTKMLVIDLGPNEIVSLLALEGEAFIGQATFGKFSELLRKYEMSSGVERILKAADWPIENDELAGDPLAGAWTKFLRRDDDVAELFMKMHEDALRELSRRIAVEGREVTLVSPMILGEANKPEHLLQVLTLDSDGSLTREEFGRRKRSELH